MEHSKLEDIFYIIYSFVKKNRVLWVKWVQEGPV